MLIPRLTLRLFLMSFLQAHLKLFWLSLQTLIYMILLSLILLVLVICSINSLFINRLLKFIRKNILLILSFKPILWNMLINQLSLISLQINTFKTNLKILLCIIQMTLLKSINFKWKNISLLLILESIKLIQQRMERIFLMCNLENNISNS
jgi:hypothetical protein